MIRGRKENISHKNQFLLKSCEGNIAMVKLYIFVILSVLRLSHSLPIDALSLVNDDIDNENFDIIIDQRQNGTQNFRIKVSGFNIVIPDDRQQPPDSAPATSIEQFASLLSPTSDSNNHFNGNLDDFADLSAFFDWKKKSGNKKSSDDTQSRTKDIPTNSQVAGDSKAKVKELVMEENRKYKLLVGEKYIVPILRFLKKQTEDMKE